MPKSLGSIPDRRLAFGQTFPCSAAVARETVNFQVASSNLAGGASSYSSAVERFVYTENAGGSNPSGSIA
jgi:hypothetical protein